MGSPKGSVTKVGEICKSFHEVAMVANLVNGSQIALKGTNNPDSLRGVGLDYLVIDESAFIDERTWKEVLRPTLSDKLGGALFISSPTGRNWFYELYQLGQSNEDPDWASWQFTHLMVAMFQKKRLSPQRIWIQRTFEQEYEAKFVSYTGLVYYGFEYEENVYDLKVNPTKPLLIGMDFNIDPMTATVFQFDEDEETLLLLDEIEIYGSNTDEMAEEILIRYPNFEITVYPDPSCVASSECRGKDGSSILQSYGLK